jgi:hypothetical protein
MVVDATRLQQLNSASFDFVVVGRFFHGCSPPSSCALPNTPQASDLSDVQIPRTMPGRPKDVVALVFGNNPRAIKKQGIT